MHFENSWNYDDALLKAADACGIDRDYWDIFHRRHEVSSEVRRKLLDALGFDTSSQEHLDTARYYFFEKKFTRSLPQTAVLSSTEKALPITVQEGSSGSLCFQLLLESGEALTGSVELHQLQRTGEASVGDRRWTVLALPLPSETPLGYHRLTATLNGNVLGQANVIVSPDRAYWPDKLAGGGSIAGFNVTLYGLRSHRNWGCGDFTDLRPLIDWAKHDVGFELIGLNPLHALHNRVPYNTSPYLPLSIFYKNLIYIDIESVPEFRNSECAKRLLQSPRVQIKLHNLREAEFIQYSEVDRIKRRFLKALYRQFRIERTRNQERAKRFSEYCDNEGDLLHKFALYAALDEVLHKQDRNRWTWIQWPKEYQSPDSPECHTFAAEHHRLIEFYKYIQFVLEEQLQATQTYAKEAGMSVGLYHDLAVATDSCGSDLWAHREFYVNGCRVGAPPDDFSPDGQDWAFPPPNTLAHQENGYRLFRESVRKIMALGGALRLDHVMRLFRLFWMPDGFSAASGTYVRDNAIDLMRILALESIRNQNIVIGEDLGTVTDEIREMLARFGILSYRLFYFEKNHKTNTFLSSSVYPRQALVASSTHDLATLAGFWTYQDVEARRNAGLVDEAAFQQQKEERRRERQRMLDALHEENLLPSYYTRNADEIGELDGDLHNATIAFLAQVPSAILLLNQEDFTKETHQQNLPGSTAQYPNWQRKMKVMLEDLRSPANQPYTGMIRNQLARTHRI